MNDVMLLMLMLLVMMTSVVAVTWLSQKDSWLGVFFKCFSVLFTTFMYDFYFK